MKKLIALILAANLVLSLTACAKLEGTTEERKRAVKVMSIKESQKPVALEYIGTVDSKNIVKYSFKSGGRLGKVYVEKGDEVKAEDKLAELDKQDLLYALGAAEAQMQAAKSQYDKAMNGATEETVNRMQIDVNKAADAMAHLEGTYNKMKALYEAGSISKQQYDETELAYEQSKYDLKKAQEALQELVKGTRPEDKLAAKAQYDAANVNLELQKSLLTDSTIYAQNDGKVVEIAFEENELVAQGYPVIIVRSDIQIINAGISQKDIKKLSVGTKAFIDVDGEAAEGVITNIAEAPDTATRTYNAEVIIKDKEFRLGSIAKVKFDAGEKLGIWIPMTSIFSNGEDYVYVVKDDRAFKRTVKIIYMDNDKVMVEGLKSGEQIAVSGMKNLNDGIKVNIVK